MPDPALCEACHKLMPPWALAPLCDECRSRGDDVLDRTREEAFVDRNLLTPRGDE